MTIIISMNVWTSSAEEQTYLNKIKQCGEWGGTANGSGRRYDQSHINLDSNGYPTDMNIVSPTAPDTVFDEIDCAPNTGLTSPFYRSGQWVLLWTGTATASNFNITGGGAGPGGDTATVVSSTAGRLILNVASPSGSGLRIKLLNISGAATVTSLALVYGSTINAGDVAASAGSGGSTTPGVNGTGTYEAQYNSGNILDPDYKAKFTPFNTLRFMTSLQTNDGSQPNTYNAWRVSPSYVFWEIRTPTEICVAACNELGCNLWFCIPPLLPYTEVETLAGVLLNGSTDALGRVWSGLSSPYLLYTEWANEVWLRTTYSWSATAIINGGNAYPGYVADSSKQIGFGVMSGVQMGGVVKRVFNDAGQGSRVKRVACGRINQVIDYWLGTDSTQNMFSAGGFVFAGTCHISGTTLTIDSITSGTVAQYQEIRDAGGLILSGTYLQSNIGGSGVGSTWLVNRSQNVGSGGSPVTVDGRYFFDLVKDNVEYGENAPYIDGLGTEVTQQDVFDGWVNSTINITASISTTTMTVTDNQGHYLSPGLVITSGAASGTTIVRQITSSSGAFEWARNGTYEVSISQTVGSGSLTIANYGSVYLQAGFFYHDQMASTQNGYGIPIICYEGGQSLVSGNPTLQTLYVACKSNPLMYSSYITYIQMLANAGCLHFAHYSSVTRFIYSFGCWGCIDNVTQPTSSTTAQEYNALVSFIEDSVSGGGGTGAAPAYGFQSGRVKGPRRQIPHV